MPPRPVPLLLLPLPCVTAPSIQKRAGAVVCSRAYRSYNLAPHAIPRTGEPAVGRRGMRRGSGVSGRAAGIRGPNAGRKVSADNRDLCRCRRVQLSSVPACLSSSLGCRWSAYTPLAAALRRDEVVKRLDLGVEQLEGPLPLPRFQSGCRIDGSSIRRIHVGTRRQGHDYGRTDRPEIKADAIQASIPALAWAREQNGASAGSWRENLPRVRPLDFPGTAPSRDCFRTAACGSGESAV